jgi:hypothetical protein
LCDQMLADARLITSRTAVLDAERWASEWLGRSWVGAGITEREPERDLCREVVERACTRQSPQGLVAVAALRRVAPDSEVTMLDAAIEALRSHVVGPAWLDSPRFAPARAWRAVDPWDSERVLFVEYGSAGGEAGRHTLMAQVVEPGGTYIAKLGVLYADAPQRWAGLHEDDDVPMPVEEADVADVLADLASAMRGTDMVWPRNADADFVEVRALAWSRCRDFLPAWSDTDDDGRESGRDALVDAFMAQAGTIIDERDLDAVRSVAGLLGDYSYNYLGRGPLSWSPDWVGLFLTDWLPRKAFLDDAERRVLPETLRRWIRFVLTRRGVSDEWVTPVVQGVNEFLPEFEAAIDDEAGWGPAKQIAAELIDRGVDLTDKRAVDQVISELNAARLARGLLE